MKKLSYILSFGLLTALFFSAGCGGSNPGEKTIEEQQKENISGTWVTTSDDDVKLGSSNAPGEWDTFTIKFTQQGGVTVTGDDPTNEVDIFDVSSYTIVGDNATVFTVQFNGMASEEADISITGDKNNMTMSFTLAEGDKLGAKVMSVEGNWTFNLVKQ